MRWRAFSGCYGLTSVTIPNSVRGIGDYAFYKCICLTSIIIPDLLTDIGHMAFSNCSRLACVIIGNSVTDIGEGAFLSCSGLTEIYVKAVNPPSIGCNTFKKVPKSIPVYVCGSVEEYRQDDYWNEFTNITGKTKEI
ncbi:MAG: leucine-rich repeat domain-containing protein [Bacteroidales bacterium]|nr:leucine-rich repeat domain-containing protein [Bacteroidales bacterium]